jgi:PAS domain S-box-containing protein
VHTPSLSRRVVIAGVSVVAVLAVGLDLLLFFSLRSNLLTNVDAELVTAVTVVRNEAPLVGVEALPTRLAQLGVDAAVRRPDGSIVAGPKALSGPPDSNVAQQTVRLAGGASVDVEVSRAAAVKSLGHLVRLELVITPLVLVLAFMLLRLIAEIAVRPLDGIAEAARRTADGKKGERLRPHPADTRLGRMATAYDDMLDALEAAAVESNQAERRSDRLQERYHQVLETALDAFVTMDSEGRVVEWNHQAERTFGWTREEAAGRSAADLIIPPEFRDAHRAELDRFLRTGVSSLLDRRLEHVGQRRDGQCFPIEIKAWATRDDGQVVFNAFIRDITEERRMAAQLDGTLGALESALYESQASEVASRRFFDDAAHQLRAPITGIRACAETLMRGWADAEEEHRLLGAVVREASRAGRLMTGLLQMARLNEGNELVREPCDLVSVCQDEADRIFYVAPHLDVVVVEHGSPPTLRPELDRHALGELLANLLDNAGRHARSRIDLAIRWEKGRVELWVLDDGPGLVPGTADSVFDRFVSADGKGGSGLGLPIARALARAHGGDLTYEDDAFVVRLPLATGRPPALSVVHPDPVKAVMRVHRIEHVAEPVAQEIHTEDGHDDGPTREHRHPPRPGQVGLGVVEEGTPAGDIGVR